MTFAGWSLAQLAPLVAVGGVAITGLYLLKMRRRQVRVPFAALWEQVTRQSEARRLARRLRRLLSWLVQMGLLLLVAAALGDPRPEAWMRPPATLALVLDTSTSMDGPAGEDRSRLDAAMDRVRAELAALGPADRAVLIGAGPRVEVLAPLARAPEIRAKLGPIAPRPGEADLPGALALARAATAGLPAPRILVVTDGALDDASVAALRACAAADDPPCAVHTVSGPADNVAVTAFAARRLPQDQQRAELLARVHNLSDQPRDVQLVVEADGVPVARERMTLAPWQATRQVLPDLDALRGRLTARVTGADGARLPGPTFDDVAYAVVPPLRPFRVALVTDGTDLFLDAALLTLDEHVRLAAVDAADASPNHPELTQADLIVVDVGAGPLPDLPAETDRVVFDPWRHPDARFPIAKGRDVRRPFLTEQDRKHPIMDRVNLADVNLARGTTFRLEPGDQALVRTLGEPIVVLREGTPSILALGFDPRQSDLPLRVAFPLWLANAVEHFEQLRPGFVAEVRVGSPRELSLAEVGLPGERVTAVEIEAPSGRRARLPVEHGRIRVSAREPGFHVLRALDGTLPGTESHLAANLPGVRASDLRDRLRAPDAAPLPEAAFAGPPPAPFPLTDDPLWLTLLLLVAGVVAVEWWTYHRRVTV